MSILDSLKKATGKTDAKTISQALPDSLAPETKSQVIVLEETVEMHDGVETAVLNLSLGQIIENIKSNKIFARYVDIDQNAQILNISKWLNIFWKTLIFNDPKDGPILSLQDHSGASRIYIIDPSDLSMHPYRNL